MKRTTLRYISPGSLGKNLALLLFCFGVLGSILASLFLVIGAEVTLGGPIQYTIEGSRNLIVLFINPLILAGYGYIGGLVAGWFYNFTADRTGGLVCYLESKSEAIDADS